MDAHGRMSHPHVELSTPCDFEGVATAPATNTDEGVDVASNGV